MLIFIGLLWGGVALWRYVERFSSPILTPLNAAYEGAAVLPKKTHGLKLEPFLFKGWAGLEVHAVIARQDGAESSRHVPGIGAVSYNPVSHLRHVALGLFCWVGEPGTPSALPR